MNVAAALARTPASRSEACIEDELRRLMVAHERSLQFFARSLLRDAELARDCVQETFLRALESLRRGRPVNKQWLFKVVHNRAVDELRRQRHLTSASVHVAPPWEAPSEMSLIVRQAIDALPRQHREVLYLVGVAGYTSGETARLLGTSGSAVRQRLYRARREFRRAYAEDDCG